MANVDFRLVAQRALPHAVSIVRQLFPMGKMEGVEWRLGGLDGSKASKKGSLSINTRTGNWKDFATGEEGGDLISLLAARDGMTQKDAAEELMAMIGMYPSPKDDDLSKQRQVKEFKADLNPPHDPPGHKHFRHGEPSQTWIYRNIDGKRMFYIHRFDIGDGAKEICPQVYGELDGKTGWFWRQVKHNRPMYGLHRLKQVTKGNVVIVEGEKCADALAKIAAKKLAVLSWCGGTNAIDKTDWSPLEGRKVIIWPDADQKMYKGTDKLKPLKDQPGYKAAQHVALMALKAGAVEAIVLEFNYSEFPDGWDVADAIEGGWNFKKCVNFIKQGIEGAKKKQPTCDDMSQDEKLKEKEKEVAAGLDMLPFDFLGYNQNHYYYRPHRTQQIVALTATGHNKQNLVALADIDDWRKAFHINSRPYFDIDKAMSEMMRKSEDSGLFDMENVRGRGSWMDNGRAIFHCGDKLLIDGVLQDSLNVPNSKYVYEMKNGFSPPSSESITDAEALEIFDQICKFRWTNDLFPYIVFGWIVYSPYCGAFRWRPHIWINGVAGSGKTWFLENVVKPLTGDFAFQGTSSTTEAGVRVRLGSDARPVILDEAEAQDAEGIRRNQKMNELIRQSSCESDAKIIKGTASGGMVGYSIRATFCRASIGIALNQEADESRNVICEFRRPERYDEELIAMERMLFQEASKFFKSLTPDFIDKFAGRTLKNLPLITKEAERWTQILGGHLNNQRYGDTLGTLFGVANTYLNLKSWEADDIIKWFDDRNGIQLVTGAIESDDRRCLDHLMDQSVLVRAEKKGAPYTVTIAQMIEALRYDVNLIGDEWNTGAQHGPTPAEYSNALSQCGLRLVEENKALLVANSHVWLEKAYKDTQWANMAWSNSLKQIESADNNGGKAVRIAGSTRKCVRVYLPDKED